MVGREGRQWGFGGRLGTLCWQGAVQVSVLRCGEEVHKWWKSQFDRTFWVWEAQEDCRWEKRKGDWPAEAWGRIYNDIFILVFHWSLQDMVVRVENNNGEQNVGGQRVGENQGSALDQLRNTFFSYSLEEQVIRAKFSGFWKWWSLTSPSIMQRTWSNCGARWTNTARFFPKITLGRQKCDYYVTHALYPLFLEKLIKRVQEAAAYTLGVDGGSVTQRPEVNISPKNQYFFTYPKNGPARESRYPPGTWTWVDSNISARSPKKAFFLHKVAIYLSARTPKKMLFLCAI